MRIKVESFDFVKACAARVEANILACWSDPSYTPQAFLDEFGTAAAASLELNRKLVELVMTYESVTGEAILNPDVLALVGNFTTNTDGTVTVSG